MIEQEVRKRTVHLELAWNQGDHQAVAQLFGPDARMVTCRLRVLQGQEAIHDWVRRVMGSHPVILLQSVEHIDRAPSSTSTRIDWQCPPRAQGAGLVMSTSLLMWMRMAGGFRIRTHRLLLQHS